MKEKIISLISENFADTLLTGIEEIPQDFPYTLAAIHFISELREQNIIVDFYQTFETSIIDMINRETSNYLAR